MRGVLPGLFLGLAIVCSAAFVAYLRRATDIDGPVPHSNPRVHQIRRTNTLLQWIRESALNRAYWIRASVVALGWGVVFLPVAFLTFKPAPGGTQSESKATEQTSTAAASTSAGVAIPEWPPPPDASNPKQVAILYQAQVDEAAKQRSAVETPKPSAAIGVSGALPLTESDLWKLALIALLLTAVIPLASKRNT